MLARGKLPCDVLFVGEAPGVSEDLLGMPFIGPAGKLLDSIISDAYSMIDIEPLRVAFTNLVACIPLGEDGRKVSEPPESAILACRDRLVEFVDLAQPRSIVYVGKLAEKYELEHTGASITSIQHPAAILRAGIESQGLMIQRCAVTLADLFEELIDD